MHDYDERPSGRFMLIAVLVLVVVIAAIVVASTHAHIAVGHAF